MFRATRAGRQRQSAAKVAAAMLAISVVAACGGGKNERAADPKGEGSAKAGDKSIVVGIVNVGIAQFPFYQRQVDGAKKSAEQYGKKVQLIILDSRTDASTEASNMQQMIDRKVDAVLYTPGSVEGGKTLAKKVMDAGIPVITVDQTAGDTTAYVGYDNVKLGESMAKCVVDALGGKGKVAGEIGIPGSVNATNRAIGWKNVFSKEPGIKYGPELANNYDPGKAFSVTQDILSSNPDIDAILSMDDPSALGVVRAVQAAKKKVFVQGLAASDAGMESIRTDGLSCTIYMSPYEMGVKGMDTAWKVTHDQKFEKVPLLPTPKVDKTNVAEIAKLPGAGW